MHSLFSPTALSMCRPFIHPHPMHFHPSCGLVPKLSLTRELLEREARDLGHDVVDGRLERGGGLGGDVICNLCIDVGNVGKWVEL